MFNGRDDIIDLFEKWTFPFKSNVFKTKKKEESEEESEEELDENKFFEYIQKKSKNINYELFKDYFKFLAPTILEKKLFEIKDKNKYNKLVNVINSGLKDLKEEIKKMSEAEIEIEDPESIVEIVEEILKFNEQNQQGKGLKILTPNQMLSRLPITLAQLKAGNNFLKLKNEIRQLLHSLYRSKKLTKQLYKSLIDII